MAISNGEGHLKAKLGQNNGKRLKSEYEKNAPMNMIKKDNMKFSMRDMFINPLRKVAVGTVQSAFLVIDKTMEGVSNAKEGFEDIVAEAQYQNKKKHLEATDNI